MASMKIGELARRLGVNTKTIRYYEELGLMPPSARTDAGYRVYGPAEEERLRFILGAKALGLQLGEIKEIVTVWSGGQQPCRHVSRLLAQKLADLDRRIAELVTFRDELARYKAEVERLPAAADVPCAHIQGVVEGAWHAVPPAEDLHPRR